MILHTDPLVCNILLLMLTLAPVCINKAREWGQAQIGVAVFYRPGGDPSFAKKKKEEHCPKLRGVKFLPTKSNVRTDNIMKYALRGGCGESRGTEPPLLSKPCGQERER